MRKKRPNVLIFMTDQQQERVIHDHHPCYTPNLSRFKKEGLCFNRTYTTMAHCCPSRASFFTGKYPSEHGVLNNVSNEAALSKGIKKDIPTIGELLNAANYDMYFSGKWHLSSEENPFDRGWKELKVTASKDAYMSTSIEEWSEVPHISENARRERGHLHRPGWKDYKLYGTGDGAYNSDLDVIEKATMQLDKLKQTNDPWCMYVGLFGPHDPFIVPEKYLAHYDAKEINLPDNYRDTLQNKPGYYKRMKKQWDQLTEEEVKESIMHYWAYNTMVDDLFGKILDTLERNNQVDDTLVLFLSDHGESLGAHGLYLKGASPFEETYRIPCVIRWPEGIEKPGRDINELVSMIDLAPTLLEVANVAGKEKMSGVSLVPFFRNEEPEAWKEAVFTQCNGVEIYYTQRMVITNRYKLVYTPVDTDELYDLLEDPGEMKNLIEEPAYSKIKKQLFSYMWENAARSNDRIFSHYPTATMADYGPTVGVRKERERSFHN
ncbi:sulfatase-like hydrolase/transferase [Guptibacillus hwajinpoensis]|uniref:sulfatase-like hydrolase/transferase n=1 Tax=Guptibacillus hwajinpoensis TaxID=208199 RepID=UPI001CD3957E|nr:sulfatase-like hydrolase/transferase [Pseudalkalibacillus hwajinpoensis]MCA0991358.1 sulfatase-like hydrolase/transferase [Pseudalkalibacillus hwajinpoensis]